MESYEATREVFSRIQTIDPENASKIMGYILLHHGEKDMIRFAYGPETLIVSMVNKAKTDLGLMVANPLSHNHHGSNPIPISRPNPLHLSPRPSPPLWSSHDGLTLNSPSHSHSLSYAAAVLNNGGGSNTSPLPSPTPSCAPNRESYMDDGHFLSDPIGKSFDLYENSMDLLSLSPGCRSDSMVYPYWENSINGENSSLNSNQNPNFHRRSVSFNDVYFGTDDSTTGFGSKPCLYYSRGGCKNGSTCKFVHGFHDDINNNNGINNNCGGVVVGSPGKFDAFEHCQDEILRSKFAQQQRIAAHLMSGGGMNLPCNKLNFLQSEAQRSAAAALMMGEDFHKFSRMRMARNEFAGLDSNPGSRQIYLTFPADSTFKEEDVSNYFNLYGPVQDVRIPYQQKRMFGFVTFVYPETVKLILAKGNPHFVCDSRVLVKPYKEKSKLPDKKQHQPLERGDFSQCSSPSGHEFRDPFDFRHGGRMMFSTKEMLLRKKIEEADMQQAIEFQGRRLMNLQFLDLKNYQNQHCTSVVSPIVSPSIPHAQNSPSVNNGFVQDVFEENNGSPTAASDEQVVVEGVNGGALSDCNGNTESKEDDNKPNNDESELSESGLEHILPDNLFASPKKSTSELRSSLFLPEFDNVAPDTVTTSIATSETSMPASSPLSLAPHKSCFFEMPRIPTGQGALEL